MLPMYSRILPLTSTAYFSNLITRLLFRCGLLLISVSWLALSSETRAVSPPPDGGYFNANTAEGTNALFSLTSGFSNTAIGLDALYSNTTGSSNTAIGTNALLSNTADNNTANGFEALSGNTIGSDNTATGFEALINNTTGFNNTATGAEALRSNTTGNYNTANGFDALYSNSTGTNNIASGANALFSNTSGGNNIANGIDALYSNTTGYYNTADGDFALYHNTVGHDNTGNGNQTLFNNTSGNFNVALGNIAGYNVTTGSNNIDIGNLGVAGDANKIRIGKQGTQKNTYIAGIFGATVANGVAVRIDSTGHLGTLTSSARFKTAIKPMAKASEAILQLKPVTFRYKEELDPDKIPQFGLVAEQVEKVNPDLVVRDADGKVNTVRYEAVNAMLLNEFLKEHRIVGEQKATITGLEAKVAKQALTASQQQKQIEALSAGLQKVNARLDTGKSEPQLVVNNQ